jgi:ABC-type branched-subunit amino acid transport system ATPase component/ABC-type branched-subunit amino acid transport system permease subunit
VIRLSRRQATAAVTVVAVLIVTQLFPHKVPLGTVLDGAVYGSLNGLVALGLVLTYRVTRAINFAYGSMGGLAAGIGVCLYLGEGWPWGVAIPAALVIGGLIGLGTGALVNWRFAKAPRLVLTVATIGLSQLLGGLALYVPRYLHAPALLPNVRNGLSTHTFNIRPVLFNGNDVVVVIVVPVVVALVSWFLLGTDAGRAVRAIADNSDRARLLGVPARRLLLGVWTLTGVIAALAAVLGAPRQGIALNAAVGPTLLLPPLAAAVVAKMESLVTAFVAGISLGVVEEVVRLDVNKQSVEIPIFLAVILVALLVQRRSQSRAEASEDSWSAAGAVKPIPDVLRALPEVRIVGIAAAVILAVVALGLPAWLQPGTLHNVSTAIVFGIAALSLVVLSGWSGTVSLGQMAVVGVGAIVAGNLMMHLNLDFFVALILAAAGGALAALVLGAPALRVRGLYLAVTTLAFAVAAEDYFYNPSNYSSALPANVPAPILWKRFPLSGPGDLYLLCLGTLVFLVILTRNLRMARTGRAILASRDNLRAAETAALPTTQVRLMAFMLAGAIAGIAGALDVVLLGSVQYESFPAADSITVFAMVVIGGISSIPGALAGVGLFEWIGIAYPKVQLVLTGTGLLIVLMFLPSGLVGIYERLRDAALVRLARRRGLDTSVWGDAAASGAGAAGDGEAVTAELEAVPAELEAVGATRTVPVPLTVASSNGSGPAPLLDCSGVNASYGHLQVLFGIDLAVGEGEIIALLGTNGAGKSSVLKAMTGLLPSGSGRVTFDGRDITKMATEDIANLGLTMMPGGRGVFPTMTVKENLQVACWPMRSDRAAAAAARRRVQELFPILAERAHMAAGNLSGGEQQMLSLAMAFIVKPKLLCIDELSLGLAPAIVATLVDAVKDFHRQGTTVVIVEQSVNVALLLAERATFLEKGQVRFTGPAADLLERPDLLRAVFIGGDSAGGATPVAAPAEATPASKSKSKGRRSEPDDDYEDDEEDVPVLRCEGVVKRFGGIVAVDHVDLQVGRREVVGLIGHNGAGKTTLFDVISGLSVPTGGTIHLDGEEVTDFPAHERAIAGLGRSFQEARLFPSLTVEETLAVAFERHLVNRDPFAAAFRLPASTDNEAVLAANVAELIEMLGLHAFRHRPIGELSTGTRRIVELACVLAQSPSLLLLDEPSGGVAQAETEALGPLLRQVAAETGCAVVIIEHDMALLSSLCDRLVALELGAVIADGPPSYVLSHPAVIASYLGTDETTIARSGRRPPATARKRPLRAKRPVRAGSATGLPADAT